MLKLTRIAYNSSDWKRAERLLYNLFPQAAPNFEPSADQETKMERELRICSPKLFARYVHLNLEPNTVSESFMSRLFDLKNSEKTFRNHFIEADQNGFLYDLCDRLSTVSDEVPKILVSPLISALLDTKQEVSVGPKNSLSPEFKHLQLMLMRNLILQIPDVGERATVLREAIKSSNTTETPAELLDYLQPDEENKRLGNDPVIAQGDLETCRQDFLPRL